MNEERRVNVKRSLNSATDGSQEDVSKKTKPFTISKWQVARAFERVKAKAGSAGIDHQSISDFEKDLKGNLYKLWNRLSSGSYFPPPVKAVEIPKKNGGKRVLGIPTVGDRVAQMVVKLEFEPQVEPYFLDDSYGYRPNRSALDAIGVTRERCWRYDWVLEFDIKGLFDHIPHDLLMQAVDKHTDTRWVKLYIKRWLKADMHKGDGETVVRTKGTPQGGVISPLLANLFLHYVFDKWLQRYYPGLPWCRYADDGLVHCHSEAEAYEVLEVLKERFGQCGLELHPDKTRIVYCKDGKRKGNYTNTSFDFLGYTFRRRKCMGRHQKKPFVSFTPAVSKVALKAMRKKIRQLGVRRKTQLSLDDLARWLNPLLRGWLSYYGRYRRSAMYELCRHINRTLVRWSMRKYKKLRHHKTRASIFMQGIARRSPDLFAHWHVGMVGVFV